MKSGYGHTPVLHCTSLLRIIVRVISVRIKQAFPSRLRLASEVNRHFLENENGDLSVFFSVVLN